MTIQTQIAIGCFVLLCIGMIIWLLVKHKITEGLFYFWLVVFLGMLAVGISNHTRIFLTEIIGSHSPLSTMLFLALGFLFGASMVYSVLISNMGAKIRDITVYVAELRLDLDDLRREKGEGEEAPEESGETKTQDRLQPK